MLLLDWLTIHEPVMYIYFQHLQKLVIFENFRYFNKPMGAQISFYGCAWIELFLTKTVFLATIISLEPFYNKKTFLNSTGVPLHSQRVDLRLLDVRLTERDGILKPDGTSWAKEQGGAHERPRKLWLAESTDRFTYSVVHINSPKLPWKHFICWQISIVNGFRKW